jgi:hypothetical protein
MLIVLLLVSSSGGCFTVAAIGARLSTPTKVLTVRVLDGDTTHPIARAAIYVEAEALGASGDNAWTNEHGIGRVRTGKTNRISVRAAGYLPRTGVFPAGVDGIDVDAIVYKLPAPIAGVMVPVDFRGAFVVQPTIVSAPSETRPLPTGGRREFYTPLNLSGPTKLIPPPHLSDRQPYRIEVHCAAFADGRPLRFENPIGQHLTGLPDLRDRVPPAADGIALYDLGWQFGESGNSGRLFFVGTAADAATEQQRRITAASQRDSFPVPRAHKTFEPRPLSIDTLPVGTQLSPRFVPQ